MTALESPDYQIARDRIKGNPVITKMAAGVATVPLAELADDDGTPRCEFLQQANRAFDTPRRRTRATPPTSRTRRTAPAPRADRRGGARRARSDPRGGRIRHGRTRHRRNPPRDPDHRADAGRRDTRGDRPRDRSHRPAGRPAPAAQSRPARGRNHPMTAGKTVRPPADTARADKASGAAGTGSANVGSSRSAGLTSLRQKSSNSDSGTCARPPLSRLRSRQPSQHGANARDHAMSRLRLPGLRRSRSPSWHLARRRCWCTTAAG